MTLNLTACLMCRTPCYPNMLLIYFCFPFCFLVRYVNPKFSLSWYCFAHQDYVLHCVVLSTQMCCFLHVVLCTHTLFSLYVLVYLDSVFIWRCFIYLYLVFSGWHFPSRIISFVLLICFSLVLFCHSGLIAWLYICIFQHIHWHKKTRSIDNTIKLLSLES